MTSADIQRWRDEAGAAGDEAFVATCERALAGDPASRRKCAEIEHDWQASKTSKIGAGARVEAGQGDDYDTGVVRDVDGLRAVVAWDSGVVTTCSLESLRLTAARYSGGHRVG